MSAFQILYETDVAPIVNALERNPDLWNSIGDRRREEINSPHREAPDIWVRYNSYDRIADRVHFNDEHIPVWYPAWDKLPELKPIVFDLMQRVQGEILGGILITKVPAGKKVYPHVDTGWHVDYYDKFYIQLAGAEGCDFCVAGEDGVVERFTPKTGQVYLFDNRNPHWVDNDSAVDRMTLIVCIRTQMFGRK